MIAALAVIRKKYYHPKVLYFFNKPKSMEDCDIICEKTSHAFY